MLSVDEQLTDAELLPVAVEVAERDRDLLCPASSFQLDCPASPAAPPRSESLLAGLTCMEKLVPAVGQHPGRLLEVQLQLVARPFREVRLHRRVQESAVARNQQVGAFHLALRAQGEAGPIEVGAAHQQERLAQLADVFGVRAGDWAGSGSGHLRHPLLVFARNARFVLFKPVEPA